MKVTDEQIVTALMTSKTNAQAAEAVGLSESQFYERIKKDGFKQLYAYAQQEFLSRVVDTLTLQTFEAVGVLAEVMADKSNKPRDRLTAASMILNHAESFRSFVRRMRHEDAEDKEQELWDAFTLDLLQR